MQPKHKHSSVKKKLVTSTAIAAKLHAMQTNQRKASTAAGGGMCSICVLKVMVVLRVECLLTDPATSMLRLIASILHANQPRTAYLAPRSLPLPPSDPLPLT